MISLDANIRNTKTKGELSSLRNNGGVPAIIYGGEAQNETISISKKLLKEHTIIINSSPLGTFPNIDQKPSIPYQFLTNKHLLYDLIYNPAETAFLIEGKKQGSEIKNGFEMLELQAEESWRIWNK